MNISELYELQKQLDERIIKEKGLEGQNLLPNTILALQVELGELANEWRGFKHWSNDQEPRTEVKVSIQGWEGGIPLDTYEIKNPLLEEYVDCLHFFLSIARQRGWKESLYLYEEAVEDLRENGFDGGVTGAFIEMQYWLLRSYMENKPNEKIEEKFGYSTKEFYFRSAWFIFISLGLVGFGFTWKQICQAYLDKNKVNHERQSTGY